MVVANKLYIGGIDVTDYVLEGWWETSGAFEIDQAEVKLNRKVDDILTLANAQTFKIYRDYDGSITDSDLFFWGTIEKFSSHGVRYTILAFDKLNKAKKKIVNRTFLNTDPEAGKISEIFKTLCDLSGLSYDSTTITDSGMVLTIDKFVCRDAYVFERMKKLAQSLNWRFYYEPSEDKMYFGPFTTIPNTNDMDNSNLIDKPQWAEDKTELANYLIADGSNIQTDTTETFAGPAKTFTLTYKPERMQVYANTTDLMTGGVKGSSGIDYYPDVERKEVVFGSNQSNVIVNYTYASPLRLIVKDETSITTYGQEEKKLTMTDIEDMEDLQRRLTIYKDAYSNPFNIADTKVKYTNDYGYDIAQQVRVLDPLTGEDQTLTVQKIIRYFNKLYDEFTLGDKEFRIAAWMAYEVEYRVKKLEEQIVKESELTRQLVQITHTVGVKRKIFKRKILRINDSFVYGIAPNGVYGRGKILDDFETLGTINWSGTLCLVVEES